MTWLPKGAHHGPHPWHPLPPRDGVMARPAGAHPNGMSSSFSQLDGVKTIKILSAKHNK